MLRNEVLMSRECFEEAAVCLRDAFTTADLQRRQDLVERARCWLYLAAQAEQGIALIQSALLQRTSSMSAVAPDASIPIS